MMKQSESLLESVACEMEDYYDERSEAWQSSERGDIFTEKKESIEEIVALLQDLL